MKLIYLEMFGHDMSWAAFNVLEVMSSANYQQKRVGYLGAVQSFRPDTEVLMLATNLLKKDLTSPSPPVLSLPLITLPHIITPSLALSLLNDLLPRLTHSYPTVRKKTVVTLYRLALVYPETLRPAWPKIKERLMDENEDSSVTSAIINVVCELGWRRPQDFLPLAPRLFDLLVDGGNNWMAIKIIKLFATLTPLEPRLIRKLLPPLTSIIRTTPAMSLLYECINGIILGGILEGSEGTSEGEEIASLCVGKLRAMIVVEGDPNLKYVALLAFNRIVTSHPHLVSLHQDVILDCIDDGDISIRLRALDLVVGMVSRENLTAVVGRLMRQLRNDPVVSAADDPLNDRALHEGVQPEADLDDEDPEESLKQPEKKPDQAPPVPEDYRIGVTNKILEMCSRENYANIDDFYWYIDVLVQLARYAPSAAINGLTAKVIDDDEESEPARQRDISSKVGWELVNVAVRVKRVRAEATHAAEGLVFSAGKDFGVSGPSHTQGVLTAAVWIIGEYSHLAQRPMETLDALLHVPVSSTSSEILSAYLQSIPKLVAHVCGNDTISWTAERKSMTSLLLSRVVHFLEQLISHPNLEVQERAVEFLELMRLAVEAIAEQGSGADNEPSYDAPLILTQAMPSLFTGLELNPVAPGAQRKVPLPEELDLETPINPQLPVLLQASAQTNIDEIESDESYRFYNERPKAVASQPEPAANRLKESEPMTESYQQDTHSTYLNPEVVSRRLASRRERNKDDPFYIPSEDTASDPTTPFHNILKTSNGPDLDLDSIPIMALDLDSDNQRPAGSRPRSKSPMKRRERQHFEIAGDETISADNTGSPTLLGQSDSDTVGPHRQTKFKKSLLQVDSSDLRNFRLEGDDPGAVNAVDDMKRQEEEEEEMAKAMREVERLRLEMQRASERVSAAKGIPPEGTLVKRKKKKKPKPVANGDTETGEDGSRTKAPVEGDESLPVEVKKKKKKKKKAQDILPEESRLAEP
ncbi:MAG: U3 small nucleolar RNA-associated protein 13 [Chaenotheca gracillima]|nr:MAG: U3 small nucleolar RNA-associated protein 13 [Chaenotheca gracillima]